MNIPNFRYKKLFSEVNLYNVEIAPDIINKAFVRYK